MKKVILAFVAAAALAFSFTSCTPEPSKAIVGKWGFESVEMAGKVFGVDDFVSLMKLSGVDISCIKTSYIVFDKNGTVSSEGNCDALMDDLTSDVSGTYEVVEDKVIITNAGESAATYKMSEDRKNLTYSAGGGYVLTLVKK